MNQRREMKKMGVTFPNKKKCTGTVVIIVMHLSLPVPGTHVSRRDKNDNKILHGSRREIEAENDERELPDEWTQVDIN